MRVLIISDIHGNYYALKSVVENTQFDVLVCNGDLVMGYPFPMECIGSLRKRDAYTCMGNHDYAVAFDKRPHPNPPPNRVKYIPHLDRLKKLTIDLLDQASIHYLSLLSRENEFTVDGITFYQNHTVPNLSVTYTLDPESSQSEIENLYSNIHADILITGHTHIPYVKKIKDSILINPGSVGEPRDGDPRPSFAIFDTRTKQIELGRTEYDITGTILSLKKLNFPAYTLFCLKYGLLPEDPDNVEAFEREEE